MKKVEIFTQGVLTEGGGGYGVIVRQDQSRDLELHGGERITTSYRLELIAAIIGFQALDKASDVTVITTSEYVQKGMSSWILGWKQRNWMTTTNTPVKNADLWKILDEITKGHRVLWKLVASHNSAKEYTRIHKLANRWKPVGSTVKKAQHKV